MAFSIAWDERSIDHIQRHGVSKADVMEVLRRHYYWRNHAGGVMVIGRTDGRLLFMILVLSSTQPGFWEVRTARDANPSEKRLFIRRAKGFQ